MTHRVFLSYGRKDVYPQGTSNNAVEQAQHFTIVQKVYDHLKRAQHQPWLDKYDLTSDRPFTDALQLAVENSTFVLLFIGAHAMQSEWCQREWKHALARCVTIIPILLEGTWEDDALKQTYPASILSANGIAPLDKVGKLDEAFLLSEIDTRIALAPAPLATAYNAKSVPPSYVDRPVYLTALKDKLAVTDRTYRAGRVTGLTSQQEVTAMQGVGGIGKTTLARAFCADCQVRRAFDEIFWVEVGPENGEASVPQLMASIGARFNDDLQHYQQLSMARTSLHRHLSGKRTLIVLDDVWHENVVEHFEWAGVDCRLLITTRNKSLVEDSQPVNKLTTDEGRKLLANLLNQPDLPHTYDALVTRLDGYTLALEIAGKWLKKYRQPLATYLQNLDKDEAKLFDHLQMSKTDKNANLARSLALTYDTLEEDDQTRFRRLGAIAPASTFDEGLLCALWELQADEIMIPLHTLLDVGMLDDAPRTHDDDTPRYTQHALLRAYARALLEQHDETAAAFNRYADHIITVAEQFITLPLEQWTQLEPDFPHIDWVGDQLAQQSPPTERMGAFAVNVTGYIHRRPLAIQRAGVTTLRGLNWLEGGLAFNRADANLHRVGVLLHAIGSVFLDMGKIDDALAYFLQVLPLRRDMYDHDGEAATLHQIGSLYLSMGKMDEALTHFQQSLTIKRTLGPRAGEAMTLHSIGTLHLRTGKLDEALTHFQQALTIKRALGDCAGEAATLHQIGSLHMSMGKMDEALMHFQQALTIIRHVHNRAEEATTLHQIGSLALSMGKMDEALAHFQQALPITHEVGDRLGEAVTYFNMGMTYEKLGDLDRAIEYVERCVAIDQEINHPDLASDRQTLERLKAKRAGNAPTPSDTIQQDESVKPDDK